MSILKPNPDPTLPFHIPSVLKHCRLCVNNPLLLPTLGRCCNIDQHYVPKTGGDCTTLHGQDLNHFPSNNVHQIPAKVGFHMFAGSIYVKGQTRTLGFGNRECARNPPVNVRTRKHVELGNPKGIMVDIFKKLLS